MELDKYSAIETLRDGQQVQIRALQSDDRTDLLSAISRTGSESLRRRFFMIKRDFTDQEIDFFLNVDFVNHVALVAVAQEPSGSAIVGGGRYIVLRPGEAEVAFAVVDQYQRRGVGAALMRHLAAIARAAGFERFIAEVLPENRAMLQLFEQSGLPVSTQREGAVVHVALRLS